VSYLVDRFKLQLLNVSDVSVGAIDTDFIKENARQVPTARLAASPVPYLYLTSIQSSLFE
jgi:hypothetical protein